MNSIAALKTNFACVLSQSQPKISRVMQNHFVAVKQHEEKILPARECDKAERIGKISFYTGGPSNNDFKPSVAKPMLVGVSSKACSTAEGTETPVGFQQNDERAP